MMIIPHYQQLSCSRVELLGYLQKLGHIVLVRTLPLSLNPQLVVFQECEKPFV